MNQIVDLVGLYNAVILALASSSIAVTVTRSSIFESFRDWSFKQAKWMGKMFSCPYCFGHEVSFCFFVIYHPTLIHRWWVADCIVSIFGLIAITSLFSGLLTKIHHFSATEKYEKKPVQNHNSGIL